MSLTIFQNQIGYVDPATSILDTGWTISGEYAQHQSCNSGSIKSITSLGLIVGHQYTITYTVSDYISGSVKVVCGASNGLNRASNGTYTETLTCTTIPQLSFFSDGALKISLLSFYDTESGTQSGATICFNEKYNTWTTEYSAMPELWIKFIDQLYSVKNGQLWQHNTNETRNNFYGEQFSSKITFYINVNPEVVKNFYTMRQRSTSAWGSPNDGDINILSYKGKPNGQKSRLKKGNYRNLMGDFYADFLRDLSDPRFIDPNDALFKGAVLAGTVMEVTIENNDVTLVRLVEVDVKTSKQNYSY